MRLANGDIEALYCKILSEGLGSTLPPLLEFRRNPDSTQRLLLKGPARKLGIDLPTAVAKNSAYQPSPVIKNTAPRNTASQPKRSQQSRNTQTLDTSLNAVGEGLSKCQLQSDSILCPRERYYLAINIPASRLNPRVLGDENQLQLPSAFANQTTLQYLSHVYPMYVEKMLLIGLGDSTVSFTKFAAIHEASTEQGENFSHRFHKMYELLKQERKTMAVKRRYQDNYPDEIAQCMQLNQDLITCDNINQNWVYQKLGRR